MDHLFRSREGGAGPLESELDSRPAERKSRPTIREENERTLLEAAEEIFAEQGFAGATTAAIARRAGVPKANLHYYFATKEALYRAVVERVLTAWLAAAPRSTPATIRAKRFPPISAPRWTLRA